MTEAKIKQLEESVKVLNANIKKVSGNQDDINKSLNSITKKLDKVNTTTKNNKDELEFDSNFNTSDRMNYLEQLAIKSSHTLAKKAIINSLLMLVSVIVFLLLTAILAKLGIPVFS